MEVSSILLFAVAIATYSNPIEFDLAQKNAEASGRPLVVLVGAQWCGACRVMKNSTLRTISNNGGLDHAEYSYVDCDQKREIAIKIMKGDRVPQLVRYERMGDKWVIHRYSGSVDDLPAVRKFLSKKQTSLSK